MGEGAWRDRRHQAHAVAQQRAGRPGVEAGADRRGLGRAGRGWPEGLTMATGFAPAVTAACPSRGACQDPPWGASLICVSTLRRVAAEQAALRRGAELVAGRGPAGGVVAAGAGGGGWGVAVHTAEGGPVAPRA